jgi:hypothetical protein
MRNPFVPEKDFNQRAKTACVGNVRLQSFLRFLQSVFLCYTNLINLSVKVYVTVINLN